MMRLSSAFVCCMAMAFSIRAEPIDVWLDVDTATGVGDVDDGLMMIQCFHSPELAIRGISVVFGNTTLDRAFIVAKEITEKFGPRDMPIHRGAKSSKREDQETDACRALADALRQRRLTLLAVGPVTNVAELIDRHPELSRRIDSVIMVAGRRPGQRFVSSEKQKLPHRDANFDADPAGMQRLFDSKIPLVFAPWEVSSHVWITKDDLAQLKTRGGSGTWVSDTSQYWIKLWEIAISPKGFNPFDTLAAGYLTHPNSIEFERTFAKIVVLPDDRDPKKAKPYLLVDAKNTDGRPVIYCWKPRPEFKQILLDRLGPTK